MVTSTKENDMDRLEMKESRAQILALLTEKEALIMNNAPSCMIDTIDAQLKALMRSRGWEA